MDEKPKKPSIAGMVLRSHLADTSTKKYAMYLRYTLDFGSQKHVVELSLN